MKVCPRCNTQLADDASFCTNCGARFAVGTEPAPQPVYYVDPADHTAEFDIKDVSENKVLAMIAYLLGIPGMVIAAIAGKNSPYTGFHIRQALKIKVVSLLVAFVSLILCWTIIVPFVGGIALIVLFVIKIICFFNVCAGKAKEPAIISSLKFMK